MFLTKRQLKKILMVIDELNEFNFESFIVAFKRINGVSCQRIIDNIIDYLVFYMAIGSDACLKKINRSQFDELLNAVNTIKKESVV